MPPDTETEGQMQPQQTEPEQPPKKPKRKHTVELAEAVPFIILAIIFDLLSLATFLAPLIAVIGKFIFTAIWLMHGVMPWSKKYWSWYLISFICEFIPFVSILPMFVIGELKMIAQSRVEDKLQETTGLAQAAVQVAKFKVRQRVKAKIAAGGLSDEQMKKQKEMSKSLRFASARTIRRTMVNKAQGRGPRYQNPEEGEDEYGALPDIQNGAQGASRPTRGTGAASGSEAFDGVVAGTVAAGAGLSRSQPLKGPVAGTKSTGAQEDQDGNQDADETGNGRGVQSADGTQGNAPDSAQPANDSKDAPVLDISNDSATQTRPTTGDTVANDVTGITFKAADPDQADDVEETTIPIESATTGVGPTPAPYTPPIEDVPEPPPTNDLYREPLPANDNIATTGIDTTDDAPNAEDDDVSPPIRRAA